MADSNFPPKLSGFTLNQPWACQLMECQNFYAITPCELLRPIYFNSQHAPAQVFFWQFVLNPPPTPLIKGCCIHS